MAPPHPDWDDDRYDDDLSAEEEAEAEAEMNCGRYPDGGCSLGGTWECEAECPYR